MHLKWLLFMVLVLIVANEIKGWGSRRRSFGLSRRRFFSSRRRFVSSRRRFFSSRRRFVSRRRGWWSKVIPHSIKTASGLRNLYNSKVVKVQRVSRPLQGILRNPFIDHSGVIVTLSNGKKWLIHKGNGFGKASQTVVVDPKVMSNKWTYGKSHSVTKTTVGEFVKAGGKKYNLIFSNCHHATSKMCKIKG